MTHRPRLGRMLWPLLAAALIAGSVAAIHPSSAGAETTTDDGPTLSVRDGQTLEGAVKLTAEPVTENDSVAALTLDGKPVDVEKTAGTAHFAFDMGGNGTEARYHNYITVNDHTAEADRIYFPDVAGGRTGTLDLPGAWLHEGSNTITVYAGANWVDTTSTTAVGVEQLPYGEGLRCPNYDDFALSSISLSLLGVVADGEQNAFSYNFGDGTCGTSKKALKQDLTFMVSGEPGSTGG